MPPRTRLCSSSDDTPNAGFTSSSARTKSARITCVDMGNMGCEIWGHVRARSRRASPSTRPHRSSTRRRSASARGSGGARRRSSSRLDEPLDLGAAEVLGLAGELGERDVGGELSAARMSCGSRICWRLWCGSSGSAAAPNCATYPASSGSEISTCTSRRPGRSSASSIMSLRFVMPMIRMLLRELTPSILDRSWLTTVSWTPVPSLFEPRCLHDRVDLVEDDDVQVVLEESSPRSAISASASAKSARTFSSDWPTYLESTSGPLTIFGSLPLSILPICRAISVLPVPGGP